MNMQEQFEQLETEGYAVFPKFLDTETTARIRAHMDSLLPPVAPMDDESAHRLHILRHPIPGAIMADILNNPRLLELAQQILRANELRLLEQVLIRTDGGPHGTGAGGWHIDFAFFPRHYDATPRQTYYHMVHSLNQVPEHGGAFMIVPGSHRKTYAISAEMQTEEELKKLHADPIGMAGINVDEAIEVLPNEGDLLVFNPMALHSASRNITDQPRYVYFASFMDISAEYLHQHLREVKTRDDFPDSLRENLPAELLPLLEY